MRRLAQTFVVLSLTPVGLALPVVSRAVPAARPVAPVVSEHALRGIDAATARTLPGSGHAAGPAASRPLVLSAPIRTKPFQALGVTWDWRSGDEVEVTARVRQDGAWTPWHVLDADADHGPDNGTPDVTTGRLRGGTSPWFTGPADGYQVRVGVVEGGAPRDVRVSLVDPGSSPADGSVGASPTLGSASAEASIGQPAYVTRAQWGADESLRSGSPSYSDSIKLGFVHHTDTSNSYTSSQAAAMVRSVYAFHTKSRGWSDIGYNFLVDKYGRIFEGRYGGVTRPVIGAHTGGFNTDTFGVSLLGRYTSVAPSSAQLAALQKVFAWKFGLHYVNPLGRTTLTSRGGPRFESGTQVAFNNVSGHRDAGYTACPGYETYRRLPAIRNAIKSYMGASLYYPTVSNARPLYLTTPSVTVKATAPVTQHWRLDVRNAWTGTLVRQVTGAATTAISATWNLRDTAGAFVTPDSYSLQLHSWTSRTRARPYVVKVKVASPLPSGVAISYGSYFALVDNGGLAAVTGPLAAAVRPSPALTSYTGQRAELKAVTAPARDGLFVHDPATGALFVVVDGQRRPVSAQVVSALALTAPVSLPPAVLANTPPGPAWTDATRHPDGQVVKGSDGTMWRIESGVRRPFTSTASRTRWTKGVAVPLATTADLALPLGAALAPPEGTVLRTTTGGAVVSDGLLRPLPEPNSLGYALSTAPVATSADLAALPAGEAVAPDRHPSGTLLWTGSTYVEILGRGKRVVDKALLATDARAALVPNADQYKTLMIARWTPPTGLAGRGADGTVRVVDNGRLVALAPQVARDLGYEKAELPALEAYDFGPLPAATALPNAARHPAGSLVTDGSATWLLDAGVRRPVAASLVPLWRRPALPATTGDLALAVATPALAPTGAWVVTADGRRWLVDRGARRLVSPTVARRLGLDRVPPVGVVAEELNASTAYGGTVG
ncbi:MAG TPA: N-acetylmuramoyl-L-alanine amidase [Frankiaceae bacterium]|nr:N-acetylmuramoyl-L-alanine amidase [Frankiaceae bacterium]